MVYFIAGGINSGKSTTLVSLFNASKTNLNLEVKHFAGGFVSEKQLIHNKRFSYTLRNLNTNETIPLAIDQSDFNDEFSNIIIYNRFNFNKDAFKYANSILTDLSKDSMITDIFIDEIGKIEIQGEGFASGFKIALDSRKNLYVCVRESLLPDVIETFHITNYQIM